MIERAISRWRLLPTLAAMAAVLLALVACSPTFSLPVDDFSAPIEPSLGQVCWVQISAADTRRISRATYRANATYSTDALAGTGRVEMRFFGRATQPAAGCTPRGSGDVTLSEEFELEREESQLIEIGGTAYGEDLAALVNQDVFWIGATASGNLAVGATEEEVHLEDGVIRVGL